MTKPSAIPIANLRHTHFDQLLAYVDFRDREPWYYGNRQQFEKRHEEIKAWLEEIVEFLREYK
jgi:hypothetical protein